MIVAATGHRPNKLGGYDASNPLRMALRERMREELYAHKATRCISGMALGIDVDFFAVAHTAMMLPVTAAVPFKGQELAWPKESQESYHKLLRLATDVVYVCDPGYAAWKLQKRNEWMVDNCDLLIAVWDGSPGGTANCVKYAMKQHKEILRIDPRDYKLENA